MGVHKGRRGDPDLLRPLLLDNGAVGYCPCLSTPGWGSLRIGLPLAFVNIITLPESTELLLPSKLKSNSGHQSLDQVQGT